MVDVVRRGFAWEGVVGRLCTGSEWERIRRLPTNSVPARLQYSQARALLDLTETELCRRVTEASCRTLGELQLVTQPAAFPMTFVHVKQLLQPRLSLTGDAAHGVPPLA